MGSKLNETAAVPLEKIMKVKTITTKSVVSYSHCVPDKSYRVIDLGHCYMVKSRKFGLYIDKRDVK